MTIDKTMFNSVRFQQQQQHVVAVVLSLLHLLGLGAGHDLIQEQDSKDEIHYANQHGRPCDHTVQVCLHQQHEHASLCNAPFGVVIGGGREGKGGKNESWVVMD